MIEIIN